MLVARQGRRTVQGARDLLERRQRRVALERLRERSGARGTDLVVTQTAARRGGSGMFVVRQGRRHRARRAQLTAASSASGCSRAPPTAPRRPPRRSGSPAGCSEEKRVSGARGNTGPPAQSRARATYSSDVRVALLLSASDSAAAAAPPIRLNPRLQRGRESGMLVARQGRRHRAGRARLT